RRMTILGYIDQTDIKVACTVPRTDFPLQHKSIAHSWGESGIAVVCTLYSRNPEKSVAKNFEKREQASTFSNFSGYQIILFPFFLAIHCPLTVFSYAKPGNSESE